MNVLLLMVNLNPKPFSSNCSCPIKMLDIPHFSYACGSSICSQILTPYICIPPSKLHLHSYELSAHFFPSLLYHICFSTSYVWKNSSVFLLTISHLWTPFLLAISTAPSQTTTCCHSDQSSIRLSCCTVNWRTRTNVDAICAFLK